MKFKAVLFDLDGTLLDTIEDLADSMNRALRRFGFPEHPVEPYKQFVGDGAAAMARRALPEDQRDEETVARCVAVLRSEYARRWAEKTRPYEGVAEMLDGCATGGLAMSVLSNKPDDFTRLMVAELLPHWRFAAVRGQLPGRALKPDPTAAVRIAESVGVAPAAFLYLGDTGTDMRTANAAGMYAVGALWGFRAAEELTANGARKLIEHPTDLLDLISR